MARLSSPLPTQDPGLGEKFSARTRRIVNRDGSFNVRRAGRAWVPGDWYFYWVSQTWRRFFLAILGWFLSINSLFACGYLIVGYEHLKGAPVAHGFFAQYLHAFFFSVQTFNTVGYGVMSPDNVWSNLLASFEALCGVLTYAVMAGLVYARFSRPTARILFSDSAIITLPDPNSGYRKLMFRIANQRTNTIIEMTAQVLLSTMNADFTRRYYQLPLERNRVTFFPLNWTLVHRIDEESPLYEWTAADLESANAEILILLRGYDDSFAQDIHSRSSYTYDEVRWGHRFVMPYKADADGELVLDLGLLHRTEVQ